MDQHQQQRRGSEDWREVLARFADSGLTVRAFCEREGFSPASFYRWQSMLSASPKKSDSKRLPRPEVVKGPVDFVDLGGMPASHSRWELRLDLGGGLILHLVRG